MKKYFYFLALISLFISLTGCHTNMSTAVITDDIETMKSLIATGSDVNEKGAYNYSLLHWAAQYGRTEIARLLIEKGADINLRAEYYGTPLIVATYCGSKEIVKMLLEKGANTTTTDGEGKTALNYAVQYKLPEIARMLQNATPSPAPAVIAPVADEKSIPGGAIQAQITPGVQQNVKKMDTVNLAVFSFESVNMEASPYGLEITNTLAGKLKNYSFLQLTDRRELENFLAVNDLQQNNNLKNIIQIGSRLGIDYILSGWVEKREEMLIANFQLVSVAEKKSILSQVARVFGRANLEKEATKFAEMAAVKLGQ
jgi:TolB-like protein